MKSVLYCGCTVNAYMPFHGEHSLSLLARTSLFRRGFSLSLSDSSYSTSLFARYLARWPPAQPMKARGGELLRRSYGMAGVAEGWGCCLRNVLIVSATPTTPRQPPRARNHPPPLSSRPPLRWRYHSTSSLLPLRSPLPPALLLPRARESARPPPTALCLEF